MKVQACNNRLCPKCIKPLERSQIKFDEIGRAYHENCLNERDMIILQNMTNVSLSKSYQRV